jgi:hypothetical protein
MIYGNNRPNKVMGRKNSIEPSKKSENRPTFDLNDGINEIKTEFSKKECGDIGKKRKWIKTCPSCGRTQIFKNESQLARSISRNGGCIRCILRKNHIGEKLGKITIINQYYTQNKRQSELKIEFVENR